MALGLSLGIIAGGRSSGGAGGGAYVAQWVVWNGTSFPTLTDTGAALAPDSPKGIFSTWVLGADFFDIAGAGGGVLFLDRSNFNVLGGASGTANALSFALYNASNSNFYVSQMNSGFGAGRTHILAAWDLTSSPGVFQLYLNDVPFTDNTVTDNSPAQVNYSDSGWTVGGGGDGTNGCVGKQADYYFAPGQYLDLADAANRRKFIDGSGNPVDLGTDGSLPTGTVPAGGYFTGLASNWIALMAAQGFTLTGALTDGGPVT